MEKSIVYHGSNVEVSVPRILQNGFYKDFGYGFYCTGYEKQAKRWAMTRKGASVVNCYEYVPDAGLRIKKFCEMTDEWLDSVSYTHLVDVRDKYRIRIYNGNAERISLEKKSKKSGMTLKSACRIDEALCRRMMAGQGMFLTDAQMEGNFLKEASAKEGIEENRRRKELLRSMRAVSYTHLQQLYEVFRKYADKRQKEEAGA